MHMNVYNCDNSNNQPKIQAVPVVTFLLDRSNFYFRSKLEMFSMSLIFDEGSPSSMPPFGEVFPYWRRLGSPVVVATGRHFFLNVTRDVSVINSWC